MYPDEFAGLTSAIEDHLDTLETRVERLNDIQDDGTKFGDQFIVGQKVAYAQAWRELKEILDAYV